VAVAQLPQASGSARCRIGGTEVLVSVKARTLASPARQRARSS